MVRAVIMALVVGAAVRGEEKLRIAFSSTMFTEVNRNDATAAVKVWAETVAKERGIAAEPKAFIFDDVATMTEAVRGGRVDLLAMTYDYYRAMRREVALKDLFVSMADGQTTEEYVVLARADAGVTTLADLRGGKLVYLEQYHRACLSQCWLETELAAGGLGRMSAFFGDVVWQTKLSRTVLRVFFGQADACLVTRRGFDTMVELNPQLGRRLRVVASGPPVVPSVVCFRGDYESPIREDVRQALAEFHQSPAGRQVLLIFLSDRLIPMAPDCLASAERIVTAYEALAAEPEAAADGAPAAE